MRSGFCGIVPLLRSEWIDSNKIELITYLTDDEEGFSEEPDEGNLTSGSVRGGHSSLGAITPVGGAL